MRKLFLPMLAIVVLTQSCALGKKTHIDNKKVTFDFLNPVYPKVETIDPKQNIEVVLTNVTRAAYEITINDSLVTYTNQQPSEFNQLFKVPSLAELPKAAPPASDSVAGKLPKAGSAEEAVKANEKQNKKDLNALLGKYPSIELSVKELLSYAGVNDELKKLLLDCSSPVSELKTKADTYITTAIPTLAPLAASFPLGIEKHITGEAGAVGTKVKKFIDDAEALKKKYEGELEGLAGRKITLAQYKSLEKPIKEDLAILEKALKNATDLRDKLFEFEKAKAGRAIEEAYSKVLVSRTEISKLVSTGFGSDEAIIRVNIKKKGESDCAKEITSFPITVIVNKGVKIDFSTGLAMNIGQKYFFDQSYRADSFYRADESIADSIVIRRNHNRNIVVPSIGVFMNVYVRGLRQVKLGGLVGASIGTDQRVYYHVGGNLLFGKSDRLVLGFGASIAKANMLDGKYTEGQVIKRAFAPTDIPTQSVMRIGGFVSVAWNLNLIK